MRNQLINYVNLLFAGNPEAQEMKEEILQNTLDRYDDLISQGKTPEAAYSLSISGIGDLGDILAGSAPVAPVSSKTTEESPAVVRRRKLLRSIAIALYILCPVPLFIIQNQWGLSLLLAMVAIATGMIVFAGKEKREEDNDTAVLSPQQKLQKAISNLIWAIGTILYFIISFTTMAWHITWVIFPLLGAVEGLIKACMDLKEAK